MSVKGAKIAFKQHKDSLKGSKIRKSAIFKKYDSLRSKICQMLSTSYYNHFRKTFRVYGICKNWLLSAKGAKITSQAPKGHWGSKISKSAIFQKICLSDVQKLSNVEY